MSRRHNPAVYDPVVDVTPEEAERNKRRMGKTEAAYEDPRGKDHSIPDLPEAEPTDSRDDEVNIGKDRADKQSD